MSEEINSEALDKLFEIDGELYGAPSLVRMARIRASILHASAAWGSSDDGALIGALANEVERLREAHSTVEAVPTARIAELERVIREAEWIVEHAGYPLVAEEMRRALAVKP